MTHKETILAELENCYDKNLQVPEGLYIPYGQKLLIKECPQEEYRTAAGIVVPGSNSLQHAKIGVVYRVGEGVQGPIKIGMTVAFDKHVNFGVTHKGESYYSVEEFQVHAIVPPKNYLMPHVPDTEENRRSERIDRTKRIKDKTDLAMDALDNGDEKDYREVTGAAG